MLSTYGMMMLTSTAVTSNSESSKEQIRHNRLLINMTIQQIRQRLEWNLENETAKATQHKLQHILHQVQLKTWPNLAPTHASIYIAISCYCSLCTQAAACLSLPATLWYPSIHSTNCWRPVIILLAYTSSVNRLDPRIDLGSQWYSLADTTEASARMCFY